MLEINLNFKSHINYNFFIYSKDYFSSNYYIDRLFFSLSLINI